MATIKNIPDSYTINVPEMVVNGNLMITGNSTNIYSTNLTVTDNIITLNGNVTGTPTLDAAIEVNRGSSANVSLRWNETTETWQITNDGSTFNNIATAGAVSANIDLTGYTIYDTTSNVTMYMNTIAGGGSGVFVDADGNNQQELVTKSKALAFSIIFG
jgi:hypothetical protein